MREERLRIAACVLLSSAFHLLVLHVALSLPSAGGLGQGDGRNARLPIPSLTQIEVVLRPALAITQVFEPVSQVDKVPHFSKGRSVSNHGDMSVMSNFARYVPIEELTEPPDLLLNVPEQLGFDDQAIEERTMRLELFINAQGGIDDVRVLEADMDEVMADRVRRHYFQLRFIGGRLHGIPVNAKMEIEVSVNRVAETLLKP